jgi:phosphatidylglycerophosphate synthase
MADRPVARVTAETRLLLADLLTLSRAGVVPALVTGRPPPGAAVVLVVWAWASDAADGRLARSAGGTGRLAALDRPVDAAVAVGVVFYLGDLGVLPALATRVGALVLVVGWALTRVLAVQMLLVAVASASFLAWVVVERPAGWFVPPALALLVLAVEWERFRTELLPAFLRGWARLLTGRRDEPPS